MKILFCQIIRGLAGSEKYLIEIMPMLKQKGINCDFLCVHLQQDGDIYKKVTEPLQQSGIKVHFIKTEKQLSFQLLKSIKTVVKNGNYNLLHSHLIHADLWFVLAKILFRIKIDIVSTKHGFNEAFTSAFGYNHQKRLYNAHYIASLFVEKFIKRSFAVSNGVKNLYIGQKICKSNKIETIHLGFKQKTNLATKPKPINKAFQLIIVGRLIECKGHEFVLKALPKVIEKFEHLQLKIVGTGEHQQYLQQLITRLKVNNNVTFCGYSSNAMQLIHEADLMIVPSKSEGFGIVFLEAFEAKTPLIAFNVTASNEIIENNIDGFLIEPFNIDDLANKIIELLADKNKRLKFSNAGYKKLQTTFTPQQMVDKTIAFYQKVLNSKIDKH